MQNLLDDLVKALSKDERCLAEGKLLKNKVIELALKLDANLIKTLLSNKTIKKHFFAEVEDVLVFDKIKFQQFVSNKQFLPDSYTVFKNKIGLINEDRGLISDSKEVVLAWAYKDCVLEGGQDKEDANRDEIFWNETIAPDEIDRLLYPKVLTNFKRYDNKEEHKLEKFNRNDQGVITDNLIVKGNNLLALHSIKKEFSEKIKLIYIDPPYNTGNDSFKYNDSFNHSTWLTFMKDRLEAAKTLLSNEGSIFISIDANEIGYLQILCDEIFGRENRANLISVKRGSVTGHKAINPGAVNITEYIMVYAKDKTMWSPNRVFRKRSRNDRYDNFVKNRDKDTSKWEFCSLLDAFADGIKIPKSQLRKQLGDKFEDEIFSFIKDNANAVIQFAYPDIDKVGIETKEIIKKSNENQNKVFHLKREDEPDLYLLAGQRLLFYSDRLMKVDGELVTAEPLSDFWDDVLPNDLHNEGGVKLKKGKKPEKLIQRIIDLASKPGDIILDFFVGSGTSSCVSLKMERQFIGIEQLNYENNDSVNRLINTINGEKSGISKAVNWQGGGSFVYCELAKYNENYIESINKAKTTKALKEIWTEIQDKAFLSYKVDIKAINENIDDFNKLSLDEQKKFLLEVLDKNMLYVNYCDIKDTHYNISEQDKKLNKDFYKDK